MDRCLEASSNLASAWIVTILDDVDSALRQTSDWSFCATRTSHFGSRRGQFAPFPGGCRRQNDPLPNLASYAIRFKGFVRLAHCGPACDHRNHEGQGTVVTLDDACVVVPVEQVEVDVLVLSRRVQAD